MRFFSSESLKMLKFDFILLFLFNSRQNEKKRNARFARQNPYIRSIYYIIILLLLLFSFFLRGWLPLTHIRHIRRSGEVRHIWGYGGRQGKKKEKKKKKNKKPDWQSGLNLGLDF